MVKFSTEKPIYAQIVDLIQVRIITGVYQMQTQLPSVRDLAVELGVNPNTVQRAYAELEQRGFVRSERTIGRFVTGDIGLIRQAREALMQNKVGDFIFSMRCYGCSDEEILSIVHNCMQRVGEGYDAIGM